MKNIKVYNYFYKNRDSSFKIKLFMISLVRTFVFNLNGDRTLYYRKNCINSRKISLVGQERKMLLSNRLNLKDNNFSKFNIRRIDNIIYEYIGNEILFNDKNINSFDIVMKNKNKRIITSDSIVRKIFNDEIVTMCFEENLINKEKIWINNMKDNVKYNNLNLNS